MHRSPNSDLAAFQFFSIPACDDGADSLRNKFLCNGKAYAGGPSGDQCYFLLNALFHGLVIKIESVMRVFYISIA